MNYVSKGVEINMLKINNHNFRKTKEIRLGQTEKKKKKTLADS